MSEQVEQKAPATPTKKSKKKTVILSLLALVAIVVFSMLSVGIYAKKTQTEGTEEPSTEPAPAMTELPSDNEKITAYLDKLFVAASDTKKTKIDLNTDIQIYDITTDKPDEDGSIISYIQNPIKDTIKSYYPSHGGDYGDDFNEMPRVSLTAADVISATCVADTETEEDKTRDDYYDINVECNVKSYPVDTASNIFSTFSMAKTAEITEKIKQEISSSCKIVSSEITPTKFFIEARANRLNDQLVYAKFGKEYKVKLGVEFIGDYAAIGTRTIECSFAVYENFNFDWAGISFTAPVTKITTHDNLPVSIEAKVSKNATKDQYKLTFASSDDSIVSIDAEGNIDGVKENTEPAIITATLEYLGNTYTASCMVYCITSVDKVNTEPEKAEINVGQTLNLTAEIKPNDATINTVKWYTEDEKVATVSADGVVTAVGKGETKVYAVTDEGYFRSSCVVTVK